MNDIEAFILRLDERLDRIDQTTTATAVKVEALAKSQESLEGRLRPVEKHVAFMGTTARLGGLTVAAVGFLKSLGLF